jgi:hypothetical protein
MRKAWRSAILFIWGCQPLHGLEGQTFVAWLKASDFNGHQVFPSHQPLFGTP